ncbi:hypothetical protein SERLA73DRAFT_165839 [Serpula lacrymans var. lacrymans S7.3]|uniref:BAR-domain-containing protein n=1 Tax=Serpula lacrymans var. lacrymans (strain S7.3) TaxID=936435 RepID=F8PMT0_SERL3|nr:hypothetical protein SERLA73DRAFT_165839 [Serpula lacrymans var. lacrymans S7.3]
MASKQWAGEKIYSRDKTVIADEFKELEQDIDLRKEGLLRMQTVSEVYHRALSKKKESAAAHETEKLMPIDALGIVMITHGEEFGEDSEYGTSLVKMGRAHCKVATLQEAYALTFNDTFISSCQKFGDDIKDYEHQRKKLESRRLSYDAAITKAEKLKSSKKEKDKKEAEEELQRCRLRYEETSEDVRVRMHAIQENEIQQLRELTTFLDLELNFAKQYYEVLKDVKQTWCNESTLSKFESSRSTGPLHVFSRSMDDTKFNSVRSKRSTKTTRSNAVDSSEESEGELTGKPPLRRKSDSGSKPPSRPTSRASRLRSDSAATVDAGKTDRSTKRKSVTGWASSAVSTISGRGKKENFSALPNDEDDVKDISDISRPPSSRSFTKKSPIIKSKDLGNESSPRIPIRILKPPSRQDKKIVRALYDFTGSSDELSFKAGDEIMVINEVLEDWWLGELDDGRRGLFPTPYTEISTSRATRPPLPHRFGPNADAAQSSDDELQSDDEREPFDDPPLMPRSPLYGLGYDTESITSTVAEEDEERRLMPAKKDVDIDLNDSLLIPRTGQAPFISSRSNPEVSLARKAPPPPPPRRSTGNVLAAPPVPDRRAIAHRSQSNGSLSKQITPASSFSGSQDGSPFDSLMDVSAADCKGFRQNPFKPRGFCSNCFQMHT